MALSDYDFAAWGPDGQPHLSRIEIGNSRALELYKNRMMVEDESSWDEGGEWMRPTVGGFYPADESGKVADFHVAVGMSSPDDGERVAGFYVASWKEGDEAHFFGGIAVPGWRKTFDLVAETCRRYGVPLGDRSDWWHSSGYEDSSIEGPNGQLSWWLRRNDKDEAPRTDIYVGVTTAIHEEFLTWADSIVADETRLLGTEPGTLSAWLSAVREAGCRRMCQGDSFFVEGEDLWARATAPGDAKSSIAAIIMGTNERKVVTRLPHRSHAEWVEARIQLALREGKLRPGLSRRAAPAAWRRIGEQQIQEERAYHKRRQDVKRDRWKTLAEIVVRPREDEEAEC